MPNGPISTVDSQGAVIGFTSAGDQPPAAGAENLLALACGGGEFAALASLGDSIPVTTMGIRGQTGFGSEITGDLPPGVPLFDAYNADIDTVVTSGLNVERVRLFGYSHGGYFATAFAIANPARVSALILVEPALFTGRAELLRRARLAEQDGSTEALGSMISFVANVDEDTRSDRVENILQDWQGDQALAAEFRVRADNPISEDDLAALQIPVLLIGATESNVNRMVRRAAAAIPNADVWWIRGADHFSVMSEDHADEVRQIVELFVTLTPT